jgi:hypothetical protein
MIDDCKKQGWEFLFLGADIDAQAAQERLALKATGLPTSSRIKGVECSMTRSICHRAMRVALRFQKMEGKLDQTISAPNSGGYKGVKRGMRGWGG